MTTEAKLWQAIQRQPLRDLAFTRIESPTTLGISDLEYVGRAAHGWVELKVARQPSQALVDRVVRLPEPLSVEQSIWLMNHHRPRIHLVSWLLIGLHGDSARWERLVLVDPLVAALVSMGRITWRELLSHRTTQPYLSIDKALVCINQGGAPR